MIVSSQNGSPYGAFSSGQPAPAPIAAGDCYQPTADMQKPWQWVWVPEGSHPGESVDIAGAVRNFFRKFAQFRGRASRSEYWWIFLIELIISFVWFLGYLVSSFSSQLQILTVFLALASVIYGLVIFVPRTSLTIRRLHDANISGWAIAICYLPIVGLIMCALPSDPRGASYD